MTTNGVVTYVPECSSVSVYSANLEDAAEWDPTSWDYYKTLVPNVVPGIVLGALSLIACVLFVTWMCVQACRLSHYRKAHVDDEHEHLAETWREVRASDASADAHEYASDGSPPAPPFGSPGDGLPGASLPGVPSDGTRLNNVPAALVASRRREARRIPGHAKVFLAAFTLLGLTGIGTCAWGIAESIKASDQQIPKIWDIVYDLRDKVTRVLNDLEDVQLNLEATQPGVSAATALGAQAIIQISETTGNPLSSSNVADIQSTLSTVNEALSNAVSQVDPVIDILESKVLNTLDSAIEDVKPVTENIEKTYRFIVIAVLFGLLIVFTAGLLLLLPRMRYPKCTSLLLAVTWLFVALLMLVGVALLRGVHEVADDACLYAETFVYDRGLKEMGNARDRTIFRRAFMYYTGNADYPADTYFDNVTGISIGGANGIGLQELINLLGEEPIPQALDALSSIPASTLSGLVGSDVATDLVALPGAVSGIVSNATDAFTTLRADSITPLIQEAKELICCGVSNEAFDAWVAWTVSGCILFVFCLLASARVISHTFVASRRAREAIEKAAASGVKDDAWRRQGIEGGASEVSKAPETWWSPSGSAVGGGTVELATTPLQAGAGLAGVPPSAPPSAPPPYSMGGTPWPGHTPQQGNGTLPAGVPGYPADAPYHAGGGSSDDSSFDARSSHPSYPEPAHPSSVSHRGYAPSAPPASYHPTPPQPDGGGAPEQGAPRPNPLSGYYPRVQF